jgi:LPXTG-site transpeptidase (sortase) family protein
MALSREDQNVFIITGGILVVSLIALVAIFSAAWSLAKEPLEMIVSQVTEFVDSRRVYNYVFEVPLEAFNAPLFPDIQPTAPTVSEVSYQSYPDAVLSQNEITQLENGEISMPELSILIPTIAVTSPILQGNNSDELLKQGFWLAPISNTLGEGEILLFCHRTYFGPNDPKSCWNIDQLKQGDTITIKYNNDLLQYRVIGNSIKEINDEMIYQLEPNKDLVKIVTFTPRETGAQRLEIVATRVN